MVAPAISIRRLQDAAPPSGFGERVVLPTAGLLVSLAAVVGLAMALAALPDAVVHRPRSAMADVAATRTAPSALDRLDGIGPSSLPRSGRPIGGLVFVRCTTLWVANADGSNSRRLLDASGLSSPTISPDGRTIAFLAEGPDGGQELWAASSDGARQVRLGALAEDGVPVSSARSLLWSSDGASLAFTTPVTLARAGRWSIWSLDLASGRSQRLATGGPTPFWLEQQLFATDVGHRPVSALVGRRYVAERLSDAGDVVSVAASPGWWTQWDQDTVMLVRDQEGVLALQWRPRYFRRSAITSAPPQGYRFDATARLAIAEGAPVAVPLIDSEGGRDLGLFDPVTQRWTTLDYAWDPAWSPAPVATGPVGAQEAVRLTRDLIWGLVWGREEVDPDLLISRAGGGELVPFDRPGYAFGSPVRAGNGWIVPATTYGRLGERFAVRDVRFLVRPVDGRMEASPSVVGPVVRLRTIEDAVALLDRVLTADVVAPEGLPPGSRLAPKALSAWTWAGETTGSLSVLVPGAGRLTFHYGSGGFGCGPSPIPLALGTGTPAVVTDPEQSGGFNTIAWPARPHETSGPYGISGEVPIATLTELATAMDRTRLTEG
jgi:hypothetical protein